MGMLRKSIFFPNKGINNLFWKIKKREERQREKTSLSEGRRKKERGGTRGHIERKFLESCIVKLRRDEVPLNYSKYLLFFYISALLVLAYNFGRHMTK